MNPIEMNERLYNAQCKNMSQNTAAVTWTGSVTLAAGSVDPPPNKLEMVFPSSKWVERQIKTNECCNHYILDKNCHEGPHKRNIQI